MARQNARPDNSDHSTCASHRHEPGSDSQLVPGLRVCAACREVAEDTLIELPSLFDLCAYALELRPNGPRERVSEPRTHGITLCDAVISVRAEILDVLAAWCGLVTRERGLPAPDELSVRALVGFLGIHLHWLFQHRAAPDLVDDLTALSAAVSSALRPPTGFRAAVGTCAHLECGRTVYAEARREGAEPYEVACEAGHVWAPESWLSLRGKPDGNGNDGNGNTNGNGNGNGHVNGNSRAPRRGKAE